MISAASELEAAQLGGFFFVRRPTHKANSGFSHQFASAIFVLLINCRSFKSDQQQNPCV
jgi:hypothetical protein